MPEENKDLNNEQSVATQDLNNAESVDQQGLETGTADQQNQDETLADGTSKDKTVKYEDLQKAVAGRKEAEEQTAHARRQLEIFQANAQGQQQAVQQQTTQQAGSTYELAMQQLGLTADDLYDGNNVLKIQSRKAELDNALQQQQATSSANNQFITSHPDFTQVVGSVNPATGQIMSLSAEALALLQKKPHLANASAQVAYEEVMQARKFAELEKKEAADKEFANRQNLDNASQPLGGSAAGGGAAGDTQPAMMTRDQVKEIEAKLANDEEV